MAYYLNLFSPETYEAFKRSAQDRVWISRATKGRSGTRPSRRQIGVLSTKLSRWFGVLEVIEGPYIDASPIFYPVADPFVVRFKVGPSVLLDVESAIPIHENTVWKVLSFTKDHDKGCGY
jgi:hypothetical protein